ncbi:hypothetical protein RSAG8_10031, partial [Rhizoctonia solani AG-8 WAC10335]
MKKKVAKKKSTALTRQPASSLFVDRVPEVKSDDVSDAESGTESSEPLERHPEFFFDNTLVAIQVGKTLFNVHKYQLAKSKVFSERFQMRKLEGDEPEEGSSPERPIKLTGVSTSDFTALLRVLYASHFSSNQPAPEAPLIVPAFRLANMFNFSELRTFLFPLAEKNLNDVDKITFAKEFVIKEWLAPAHVRLCQREEHLSGEEARRLGVESVLIISRMREQHRNRSSAMKAGHYYCYPCVGVSFLSGSYRFCGWSARHVSTLSYEGSGKMAQGGTNTTDDTAIEAGVKKWVGDGCTVND